MCTVLIVDDDPGVRQMIRYAAQENGHTVIEASNQQEALDAVRSSTPDVIAIDLKLEHSDGFEVLERLRQAGSRGFAVVVSGDMSGHTQDFRKWKELRIFDAMNKPFNINTLIKKLEDAADATRHEGRLCRFLDRMLCRNDSSLSLSGGGGNG